MGRGQSVHSTSAVSQLSSAQNKTYAKVIYFGMACFDTFYKKDNVSGAKEGRRRRVEDEVRKVRGPDGKGTPQSSL